MNLKLDYKFTNIQLLEEALTHPSLSRNKKFKSYERLEFLGDNVINLIIAEELFKKFPDLDEGKLSQMHSNLVRSNTLAEIAKTIGLESAINMDESEISLGGRQNPSILENALEALIGAIFLDSNFDIAKSTALPLWTHYIENDAYLFKRDAKSELQEWVQKKYGILPLYTVQSETGLAHQKEFTVLVEIQNTEYKAIATGTSIKKAEAAAADFLIQIINKI